MLLQKIFKVLLFLVALNFSLNDGYKILGIFPYPNRSHNIMFDRLMKGLAKKGHQVDVISHYSSKKALDNYREFSIEGSSWFRQHSVTFQTYISKSPIRWVYGLMIKEMNPLCDLLGHPVMQDFINGPHRNTSYDLIITEMHMFPCYLAFGHHFKAPIIGLGSTHLYSWMNAPFGNPPSTAVIGYSQKDNFISNFYKRLHTTFYHYFYNWVFEYFSQEQNKHVEKYFGPGFPSVDEMQKNIALLLTNTHYSLTGVKPLTPSIVEVGGIHIEENEEKLPQDIQKWLDESENGCIYVSFGSMVIFETFPKHLLETFYAAFRNLPQLRFLLKIRNTELLPPGLPENVKTFAWLSQTALFKHKNVKAFVTHGGMMGGIEALSNSIPMIGFPLFADQYLNIENLVERNVAISLDINTVDEKKLSDAIIEISNNTMYKENMIKLTKLYMDRPLSPLDTAIYWTEYILRNGDVIKSPTRYLNWWQVELLDVYGFLVVVILLALYLLNYTFKLLLTHVTSKFSEHKEADLLKKKN